MKLRTILFGYEVVNGQLEIKGSESAVVQRIFQAYLQGDSLKAIANELSEKQIEYLPSRTAWNKNMVARILEKPKYTGADGYPEIVSNAFFEQVNQRRSQMGGKKAALPEITALLKSKTVCGQCGRRFGRRNTWGTREKWYCPNGCKVDLYLDDRTLRQFLLTVFNQAIGNPELLIPDEAVAEYEPTIEIIRQGKEIGRMTEQPGVKFGVLSKMILEHTSLKFDLCTLNRGKAMTDLLMGEYGEMSPLKELDIPLIRKTVEQITVNPDGALTVRFINHAEMSNEGREEKEVIR